MHVVRDLHTYLLLVGSGFAITRRWPYNKRYLTVNRLMLINISSNVFEATALFRKFSNPIRFALTREYKATTSAQMEEVKKIWRETDAVMLDVDSTVVKEEGIDRLAEFVGKGAEVSKITSDAMNKGLDFREALKLRLNIMSPSLQQLEDYIKKHPTTLTPGVQDLVQLLQRKNIPVYLVSGGLRRIIEPTRIQLNIPTENLFANRLLFENGKYVGFDLNEPTSKNRGKAEVAALLKKKFGYKRLVMIGDGSIDADACPPADAFIGFGGNVIRENVKAKAKWFVTSFQELIDELNK